MGLCVCPRDRDHRELLPEIGTSQHPCACSASHSRLLAVEGGVCVDAGCGAVSEGVCVFVGCCSEALGHAPPAAPPAAAFWDLYFKPLSSCTLSHAQPLYTNHTQPALPRPPTLAGAAGSSAEAGSGARERVVVWDSVTAVSELLVPQTAREWGGACSANEPWTTACVPPSAR